jgi:hypothetical protein
MQYSESLPNSESGSALNRPIRKSRKSSFEYNILWSLQTVPNNYNINSISIPERVLFEITLERIGFLHIYFVSH